MFSMGANTVFACDVGSVKADFGPNSVTSSFRGFTH